MPWAGYEMEKLGYGVEEVDDLRYEEEEHGLAEVAQDPDHCEGHAGDVAEGVADKHAGWIPDESKNNVEWLKL